MIDSPTETPLEPRRKRRFPPMSGRTKTIIALVVIALAVVGAFFAPPEGNSDNITGDMPNTPTVTITNLLSSTNVNYTFTMQNVQFNVTQVQEAQNFSDDLQHGGNYIVRVWVLAHNTQNQGTGIQFSSIVRLQLADGSLVAAKYISVHPSFLPKSTQKGYFDFPVATQQSLSSLTLHFGNQVISFAS